VDEAAVRADERRRFAAEVRVELERLCEEVRDAEPATEGDGRAMNGAIGAYTKALAAVAACERSWAEFAHRMASPRSIPKPTPEEDR
jgi:hypothetical protein